MSAYKSMLYMHPDDVRDVLENAEEDEPTLAELVAAGLVQPEPADAIGQLLATAGETPADWQAHEDAQNTCPGCHTLVKILTQPYAFDRQHIYHADCAPQPEASAPDCFDATEPPEIGGDPAVWNELAMTAHDDYEWGDITDDR